MACYYIVISSAHLSNGHFRNVKGVFRGPLGKNGNRNLDYAGTQKTVVKAANFYCELCDKQYYKHQQYDNHINSYDHAHKQRLKDLKQREFARNVASKSWKDERKQERALRRLHHLAEQRREIRSAPGSGPMFKSTTVAVECFRETGFGEKTTGPLAVAAQDDFPCACTPAKSGQPPSCHTGRAKNQAYREKIAFSFSIRKRACFKRESSAAVFSESLEERPTRQACGLRLREAPAKAGLPRLTSPPRSPSLLSLPNSPSPADIPRPVGFPSLTSVTGVPSLTSPTGLHSSPSLTGFPRLPSPTGPISPTGRHSPTILPTPTSLPSPSSLTSSPSPIGLPSPTSPPSLTGIPSPTIPNSLPSPAGLHSPTILQSPTSLSSLTSPLSVHSSTSLPTLHSPTSLSSLTISNSLPRAVYTEHIHTPDSQPEKPTNERLSTWGQGSPKRLSAESQGSPEAMGSSNRSVAVTDLHAVLIYSEDVVIPCISKLPSCPFHLESTSLVLESVEYLKRGALETADQVGSICPKMLRGSTDDSTVNEELTDDTGLPARVDSAQSAGKGESIAPNTRREFRKPDYAFCSVLSKDGGTVLQWPVEMLAYTRTQPALSYSCNPLHFDFRSAHSPARTGGREGGEREAWLAPTQNHAGVDQNSQEHTLDPDKHKDQTFHRRGELLRAALLNVPDWASAQSHREPAEQMESQDGDVSDRYISITKSFLRLNRKRRCEEEWKENTASKRGVDKPGDRKSRGHTRHKKRRKRRRRRKGREYRGNTARRDRSDAEELETLPEQGECQEPELLHFRGSTSPQVQHKSSATPEDQPDSRSMSSEDQHEGSITLDDQHENNETPEDQLENSRTSEDQPENISIARDHHESRKAPDNQPTKSRTPEDRHESSTTPEDQHKNSRTQTDQHENSTTPEDQHTNSRTPADQYENSRTSNDQHEDIRPPEDLHENSRTSEDLHGSSRIPEDQLESRRAPEDQLESRRAPEDQPESSSDASSWRQGAESSSRDKAELNALVGGCEGNLLHLSQEQPLVPVRGSNDCAGADTNISCTNVSGHHSQYSYRNHSAKRRRGSESKDEEEEHEDECVLHQGRCLNCSLGRPDKSANRNSTQGRVGGCCGRESRGKPWRLSQDSRQVLDPQAPSGNVLVNVSPGLEGDGTGVCVHRSKRLKGPQEVTLHNLSRVGVRSRERSLPHDMQRSSSRSECACREGWLSPEGSEMTGAGWYFPPAGPAIGHPPCSSDAPAVFPAVTHHPSSPEERRPLLHPQAFPRVSPTGPPPLRCPMRPPAPMSATSVTVHHTALEPPPLLLSHSLPLTRLPLGADMCPCLFFSPAGLHPVSVSYHPMPLPMPCPLPLPVMIPTLQPVIPLQPLL